MKLRLAVSFCLVIIFASTSLGQKPPAIEASLGYSFLRERPTFNRHGWVASAAGNVNSWFGAKGEIGGNYTDIVHHDAHSFLAGAQFSARRNPTVTPWSHFLLGVVRTGQGARLVNFQDVIRGGPPVFLPVTRSDFAIQPGGGVDLWLQPTLGIRLGGDYRRRFGLPFVDRDSFRLQLGIVFRTPTK